MHIKVGRLDIHASPPTMVALFRYDMVLYAGTYPLSVQVFFSFVRLGMDARVRFRSRRRQHNT